MSLAKLRQEPEQEIKCHECGAYLENTAGGNFSLCPNYHGRLKPRLNKKSIRRVMMAKIDDKLKAIVPHGVRKDRVVVVNDLWRLEMVKGSREFGPAKADRKRILGANIVRIGDGRYTEVKSEEAGKG